MKIRITPRARGRIRRVCTWWQANRDKAPGLFAEELEGAKTRLLADPRVAQLYARLEDGVIWRILLPGTEQHLYYVIDEQADEIRLLTLWGARRRRPPKF